ncbi:LAME_0F14686g1_1 [Lachancea meyersii CBS 8951]|uniref:LAME_0F14686g1_1 n=1 Tax=Lachancea meyersii CBS 8951 TaxID=1266667 RepID=A0A1G4JY22_9SACH|nr:LAME_0F14686g1_1 [Lachancea meyersii CBS 8951]
MSDLEALLQFNKKRVSGEMVEFLKATTDSVIAVNSQDQSKPGKPVIPLADFIRGLVTQSNVQVPTLMSTTVYLAKLRAIIPTSVYGIETTRHRIFLGCLILAAKNLNDSSPLNRHWASYTNGLLDTREVNTLERELLEYFDWNLRFTTQDLITCLAPLLAPIKAQIMAHRQELLYFNLPTVHQSKLGHSSRDVNSRSSSNMSIPSLISSATMSTISTAGSRESSKTPSISASRSSQLRPLDKNSPSFSYQSKDTTTRKEQGRLARPIIIKTGIPTPPELGSDSRQLGMSTRWTSVFR